MGNWATTPAGVILPMQPAPGSVNQRLPSGPASMPRGLLVLANSVMAPAGVILPTLSAPSSVNHRLPSGPATIRAGWLPDVGKVNSLSVPVGVILPILLRLC